ncbi:hypothetical protein [uncultured Stenotrophomonas sp.]|uniref:hypothetical protein n=1 Tax=uncultured Stenotrophomonas sp. TaxID=165438 RepID=UPI0028E20BC3|nr:hypothetical protein [uncultured Stenotrophomonas sp.]
MYWLFMLLAIGCFAFAVKTPSTGLMMLSLFGALLFLLAWVRGRYVATFGSGQRDTGSEMYNAIDPTELRRLREQAQARRDAERDQNDLPPRP